MHSPHIFVSYTAAGIFAYLLSDDVDYISNLFTDFSNISDELVNEKKITDSNFLSYYIK
jgi:hypothetical protein